jgi:hypothetical protein
MFSDKNNIITKVITQLILKLIALADSSFLQDNMIDDGCEPYC